TGDWRGGEYPSAVNRARPRKYLHQQHDASTGHTVACRIGNAESPFQGPARPRSQTPHASGRGRTEKIREIKPAGPQKTASRKRDGHGRRIPRPAYHASVALTAASL